MKSREGDKEEGKTHLLFSHKLYIVPVSPPISIKYGHGLVEALSLDSFKATVLIKSFFNKKLFQHTYFPSSEVVGCEKELKLPSWRKETAKQFDFISSLNELKLQLPSNYFLETSISYKKKSKKKFHKKEGSSSNLNSLSIFNNKPEEYNKELTEESLSENMQEDADWKILDSALSDVGLEKMMEYYGTFKNIAAHAYKDADEFIKSLPSLNVQGKKSPIACLVTLGISKRHVTGIYFSCKNDKLTAFVFDTMGLTLPAVPCGDRGYNGSEVAVLPEIFKAMGKHEIEIAIMPINVAISLQSDKFSCLSATMLFFEGMHQGAFEYLDAPGIIECYGKPAIYKNSGSYMIRIFSGSATPFPIVLYTTTYWPLLAGCQNTLGFLFAMDPISNCDDFFSSIVKYKSDWHMRDWEKPDVIYDVFWQFVYVKILNWFNSCYLNESVAFPNCDALLQIQKIEEQSEFEIKINEIEKSKEKTIKKDSGEGEEAEEGSELSKRCSIS